MVDRLVRFFLELQFGGCERVIEARRYGSQLAHEIANRSAQACNVMAKRRELGDDVYLEPLSPIIDLLLGLLLRVTITLLKEAEQSGIFAFDEFNILISQLAPPPFDFAFQLVPRPSPWSCSLCCFEVRPYSPIFSR